MADTSASCVQQALDAGHAVELITPDEAWATQRKLMLAHGASLGVSVQSYEHWLEAAWDLHGDGRKVVSAVQRRIMLRPLLRDAGLLDVEPSVKLVQTFAAFVEQASTPGLAPCESLTETESKLMEVVSLYERELELKGLVEPAQAEALLPVQLLASHVFVFEEPPASCVHERRFIERLAGQASVTVVEPALPEGQAPADAGELACLRSWLYTGKGGLGASGQVHVGETAGYHAAPDLLVRMIETLAGEGAPYADISVAFANPQSAYPHVHEALAQAGIPFATAFSLPLARVGFGAALCNLLVFVRDPQDEANYEHLCGFLLSPYSGVSPDAARALQERWRARAGSTAQERLSDVRQGFNEGRSTSTQVREQLQPFAELMEADNEQRVRLMFDHAHEARLDAGRLIDDRAAAEAALDYVEACEQLGVEIDVDELANVPVALERSFGAPEKAVTLTSVQAFRFDEAPHIILADLDSASFPMAKKQRTFDALSRKLGVGTEDDTAIQQRLMLVNVLEAARESFGLYRSLTTPEGDESCQSALWDEVMTVYRSPADEEEGRAVQEIPAALEPYAVRVSESGVFFDGARACVSQPVERGLLKSEDAIGLLPLNADGTEREFSPTQLEDYYRCPYRWFASRRTGYNTLDRAFDQSALGVLFHDTMARFYPMLKQAGHERVTPENLPAALDVADKAFEEQARESIKRPKKGLFIRTQQDRLALEDLHGKLRAFVERDAAFLPGFTPMYFEVELGGGGALEYATVPVRGSVDRIDVDAQGNAVIIDYKLSTLSQGYGLEKDLAEHELNLHVQTDIYATLVQRHFALLGKKLNVIGSVYRSYAVNVLRGVYAKSIDWGELEEVKPACDGLPRDEYPDGYAQYLDHVEETMTQRMGKLAAGDIAPNPIAKGVCAYCKALPFCPKGEADAAN